MPNFRNFRQELESAFAENTIVRVHSASFEPGTLDAFVALIGPVYVAFEVFDDAARLDGFICLRYGEIYELEAPAPYAAFLERALRLRGDRRGVVDFDISSLSHLLITACERYPLITIHPDAVGRLRVCGDAIVHR